MQPPVKRRTLRRRQRSLLIKEAQQDIDTVEEKLKQPMSRTTRKGYEKLLELLNMHAQQLINSEV